MESQALAVEPPLEPSRRRTYIKTWEFGIGQEVDFAGDSAIVIGRHATAKGRTIYDIQLGLKSGDRDKRSVFSNFLHATNSNCQNRTLADSGPLA